MVLGIKLWASRILPLSYTLRTPRTHMGWLRSRPRPSDSFWSLGNHTYTSHTHKQNTNRSTRILENAKGLFCNKFLGMRDHPYTSLLLSTVLQKPWFSVGDSQLVHNQNCMTSLSATWMIRALFASKCLTKYRVFPQKDYSIWLLAFFIHGFLNLDFWINLSDFVLVPLL